MPYCVEILGEAHGKHYRQHDEKDLRAPQRTYRARGDVMDVILFSDLFPSHFCVFGYAGQRGCRILHRFVLPFVCNFLSRGERTTKTLEQIIGYMAFVIRSRGDPYYALTDLTLT